MEERERERQRIDRDERTTSSGGSNRRSGAAFPPPPIYHKDDMMDISPSSGESTALPSSTTTAQSKSSVAEKMMRNMGWKGEGHGLGRNQQGIAAPIKMTRTGLGTGVIAPERTGLSRSFTVCPPTKILIFVCSCSSSDNRWNEANKDRFTSSTFFPTEASSKTIRSNVLLLLLNFLRTWLGEDRWIQIWRRKLRKNVRGSVAFNVATSMRQKI